MMMMKMMIRKYPIASKSIRACILSIFALQIIGIDAQLLPTIPSMKQIIGWPSDSEQPKQTSTSNSNITINYASGTITLSQINANYNYYQGTDGRMVCFPTHWRRVTGSDGRMVAFPQNWKKIRKKIKIVQLQGMERVLQKRKSTD